MSDFICIKHDSEACNECVKEMQALESRIRELEVELAQLKWAVKVNSDENKQYQDSLKMEMKKLESSRDKWRGVAEKLQSALKATAKTYQGKHALEAYDAALGEGERE